MFSDFRILPLTFVMVFRDFFIGDKLLYLLRIEALLLFGGQWQLCRDDIRSILLTGFSWNKRPEILRALFLSFYVLYFHFLDLSEEVRSKDEAVQAFVGRCEDVVLAAFPFLVSLIDEDDFLADAHDGVHVVSVDECGHVVFAGDVLNQPVNDERGLGVESRVGLVAEEVLRVQGDGAGNGYTLLHTAADFAGIFVFGFGQVHAVQAKHGTACAVAQGIVAEHVQGKHHVVEHRHRVEQGRTLENHSHLPAQGLLLLFVHCQEVAVVVEQFATFGCQQSYDAFHQYCLPRTALSDNQVGLAVVEGRADVCQHLFPLKRFAESFQFYHDFR